MDSTQIDVAAQSETEEKNMNRLSLEQSKQLVDDDVLRQQGGGFYTKAVKSNYDFSQNQPAEQALAKKAFLTRTNYDQSQHDFSGAESTLFNE